MPQGRRKVPYSGKAKKQQMQAKKERQRTVLVSPDNEESCSNAQYKRQVMRINEQPSDGKSSRNKYALQFFQESNEKLRKRKERAFKSVEPVSLREQEVSDNYFPPGIDMPKRPPWDFNMTKEQLETKEQRYFTEYLNSMEELADLSYFEVNLETWRQMWRVLEMSDVLLIIVDIRYPVLMFPPYLYDYVTKKLKKDMILVFNKVDLAPPALVVAWKEYFHNQYPKLHILMFTSYPTYNLRGNTDDEKGLKNRSRKGKLRMAAEGAQKLLEACRDIVGDKVDLSSWRAKIQEEMHLEYDLDDISHTDNVSIETIDTTYFKHEKYKNGVLTIGCIGTPNVGKSSLMNALMGKKVVSVSRTPGHTKHFQTIYLTKTVCLCDCPGLVFPSTVPKELQILMGSFPIAQVREPYTVVQFLAERINLPRLLKIQHPENDDTWSAMDICDGWALKRNFQTARTARLDTYRAANSLLRMSLEGKICLFIYPPNWTIDRRKWENHADVETVRWIQARNKGDNFSTPTDNMSSESEESDDERLTESSGSIANNTANGLTEWPDEENDVPLVANKFSLLSTE
ncbi:PREDICTED: guanine nucleotide-binding protein-like 1 [Vollenhovia emeryi]|uniref:guanine nucleotide-binding protein-like 1 n=1 Tax=Vollenhovia emeryi TaxID=411798 RepID=UPI0005F4F30B|nr:PREDICTED: guanine nucleotide-binding protein-like 1 [Vollenhovia emeryi]